MTDKIERDSRATNVHVDTVLADASIIQYGHAAGGEVRIPASEASLTTLTWWSCDTANGTYLPCYDSANAAVVSTVAHTQANQMPDALYGRKFLKAVGDVDADIQIVTKT